MTSHSPTSRQPARWRAKAAATLLAAGTSSLAAVGLLAPSALAASPQVTITCMAPSHCTATGTGFTPSGQVAELAATGGGTFSSSYLTASAPTLVCVTGVKPACRLIGGGAFTAPLPVDYDLECDATAAGTVSYTDVKSHAVVTKQVTYVGPCPQPTTTTLSIPSTIDTRWTSPFPATVSAGSTVVFSGTITITVNGSTFCSYTLGTSSGCTGANLPAGTDQIQATYSGSAEPRYDPSSASATVTVLPVHSSVDAKLGNWSGYVAVGDTFTSVSATWTVPAANCSFGTVSYSSTWVGLDGFGDNPVEQIGTDSNCLFFGLGEYHAWWEVYPGGPTLIGDFGSTDDDPVYPGDVISARVTATSTPFTFTLTIEDQSQAWSYTTTQSDRGGIGASAEWIEEQPSGGVQLTNFGSVTFSQCMVTGSEDGGIALPIWDHPNSALTMADGSTTKVTASPLSDDGTQFTVTFLHS